MQELEFLKDLVIVFGAGLGYYLVDFTQLFEGGFEGTEFFEESPNILLDLVPSAEKWRDGVKVIDPRNSDVVSVIQLNTRADPAALCRSNANSTSENGRPQFAQLAGV